VRGLVCDHIKIHSWDNAGWVNKKGIKRIVSYTLFNFYEVPLGRMQYKMKLLCLKRNNALPTCYKNNSK